ncbi:hypothetical protein [Dechloromonas sp. HYN0024]|uniref:hypothetical protein n=1 Tax=Dechloromonas sp. HYN0024 TaxID=2231055 RepID=UPI0013C35AA7|nr:hypothetical protein [Dechloromonas sp. HYN0024]
MLYVDMRHSSAAMRALIQWCQFKNAVASVARKKVQLSFTERRMHPTVFILAAKNVVQMVIESGERKIHHISRNM